MRYILSAASRATLLLVTFLALSPIANSQSLPARLKVIRIRKASELKRGARVPDANPNYMVRFRLEVSGDQGVYLLTLGPKGAPPLGYALERRGNAVTWLDGSNGEVRLQSPGPESLTRIGAARWIFLPASAAYEWEIQSPASRSGVEESRSVFVRGDMTSPPRELLSPWYTVGAE